MRGRTALLVVTDIPLPANFALAELVRIGQGPVVEHAGTSDAIIAWSTNISSASVVKYGTDPNHLNRVAQMPWGGLTHRVTLRNLQPGTTYYFQADSSQAQGSGSTAISPVESFTTRPSAASNAGPQRPRDGLKLTHGPVLEHIGETTATVAWSTDLPSSSVVRYGTDRNRLDQMAEVPWGATTHRVGLSNLRPHTRYYFTAHSGQGKNAPGQAIDVPPQPFTTAAGR